LQGLPHSGTIVPHTIGGLIEVFPQGQKLGWEYMTGHFLHKPA